MFSGVPSVVLSTLHDIIYLATSDRALEVAAVPRIIPAVFFLHSRPLPVCHSWFGNKNQLLVYLWPCIAMDCYAISRDIHKAKFYQKHDNVDIPITFATQVAIGCIKILRGPCGHIHSITSKKHNLVEQSVFSYSDFMDMSLRSGWSHILGNYPQPQHSIDSCSSSCGVAYTNYSTHSGW